MTYEQKLDTLANIVSSGVLMSYALMLEEAMKDLPTDVEVVIGENVEAIKAAIRQYQEMEVEAMPL